jgi:GWxTD domain-containing protein
MDRRIPALLLLTGLLAAGCGGGAAPRSLADLTNPFLGLETSSWLIGAVSRIATPEEIEAYLALRDDAAARAFIESFWAKRDPAPDKPGNPLREAFEERGTTADRLYSEAGFLGRRTDRGTIYVLYGPPSKVDFEVSPTPGEPPIELWQYGPAAPTGIDARRPAASYRFIKRGDLTVTYTPSRSTPRTMGRPDLGPSSPPF